MPRSTGKRTSTFGCSRFIRGENWIYIPHTMAVPESCKISIYRDEKNGRKTATYSVSEDVYSQYQIGDTFVAGE